MSGYGGNQPDSPFTPHLLKSRPESGKKAQETRRVQVISLNLNSVLPYPQKPASGRLTTGFGLRRVLIKGNLPLVVLERVAI